MKNKQMILITGATSSLGRRLIKQLNREDYSPYLTALEEDNSLSVKKVDLLDYPRVQELVKKIKPEIVYHLGALVDLSRDYQVAQRCIDINIKGTLNLLEALRATPPKKFIFTSTEEVYNDNPLPFKENQLPCPPSAYSVSKIAAENFCKIFTQELNFSLVIFRIATFYGPEIPLSKFIAQVIIKSLKNEEIPLNSGTKKRDYIYVDDVVEALILAAEKKLKNQIETINLGGGKSYQLKELVEMVVKLTKSKSKVIIGAFPDRILEADEWLLDNSKAKKLLGWQPKTSLEQGLRETIDFYKKCIIICDYE